MSFLMCWFSLLISLNLQVNSRAFVINYWITDSHYLFLVTISTEPATH